MTVQGTARSKGVAAIHFEQIVLTVTLTTIYLSLHPSVHPQSNWTLFQSRHGFPVKSRVREPLCFLLLRLATELCQQCKCQTVSAWHYRRCGTCVIYLQDMYQTCITDWQGDMQQVWQRVRQTWCCTFSIYSLTPKGYLSEAIPQWTHYKCFCCTISNQIREDFSTWSELETKTLVSRVNTRGNKQSEHVIKFDIYLVAPSPSAIVSSHQRLVVVVLFCQVVVKDAVSNTLQQETAC